MTEFEEGIRYATELMAISARTAPKAKGEDFIELRILTGKEMRALGDALVAFGEEKDDPMWVRDGRCVLASAAVLLVGTRDPDTERKGGKGGKGGRKAAEGDVFAESDRVRRYIDLGIALGSAAKTASILNLDNRIMWRPGEMARRKGMMKALAVIAIPVSAHGKNIYFDR